VRNAARSNLAGSEVRESWTVRQASEYLASRPDTLYKYGLRGFRASSTGTAGASSVPVGAVEEPQPTFYAGRS